MRTLPTLADRHQHGRVPWPRWSMLLASFMLAVWGLAMLFLSSSSPDHQRFLKVVGSLRASSHLIDPASNEQPVSDGQPAGVAQFSDEINLIHLRQELLPLFDQLMQHGKGRMVEREEGLLIQVNADLLFDPATRRIRSTLQPFWLRLAERMEQLPNRMIITGHTGGQRRSSADDRAATNGWERSVTMAAVLADFLVMQGKMDPARLQVLGVADTLPFFREQQDVKPAAALVDERVEMVIARN
ncbi:MAG: hypothetical protein HQL58_09470 [Magnetococcales bacterium]|nr:hypothetical protein [Magnetococcales bacterium]